MSRYKGRANPKSIERDFPHIVEMRVPEGGFGKKLDAMYEWHTRRSIRAINSTGRRDETGRDIIRWCFADRALAEAFADEFSISGSIPATLNSCGIERTSKSFSS
jgi:hypothetical protein